MIHKDVRVNRELLQDEVVQDLIFEDELTKELLACESLCQQLDITLDWSVQSTTAIRIVSHQLTLLCQQLIKTIMKQGHLCRRIRLSSEQHQAGVKVVIHFDAAVLLPDWHQNQAFIWFCNLARQSGWQVKLCHTERLKRLQLFVKGEVLAADSSDASNRQIRRDGLADYGQYVNDEQRYRPCIMLFEPNPEVRRFIVSLLQRDYLVLLVPDDDRLLEWVKREQPDLILADVLAIQPDALAFIRHCSEEQTCRHIPLLVLSGFKDLATKTECLLAGAVDYLSKPFHAAELLLKIRNQIRQRIALTLLEDKSQYLARLQTDVAARDLRFTKRLEDVVAGHYQHADFTIPALAKLLGYSERQLQRRCLRIHQSSPAEYLQEFRLQRAKALLQQGQPLKLVAYGSGFSSDQYFSKCYKKRFGITPAKQQK